MSEWRSGFGQRIVVQQRDVAGVRLPLDAHVGGLPGGQRQVEIMVPGIPVLPPAVEHFLPVDEHLHIARRIEPELVIAGGRRVDGAGPFDELLADDIACRVLARGRGGRLRLGRLRPFRLIVDVLVIDRRFLPLHDFAFAQEVTGGEARLAVLARDLQLLADEGVRLRIAEAGDRIVVPQHAVIARRDDERDGDVHVVLGEFDVLAIVVHLPVLVLAEAVEALVRAAIELLRDCKERLALGRRRREHRCAAFGEDGLARRVTES